ncbi:MAG TPA: AMP-binding protein, partial [Bacteroidales bacterium]|nr:AMP-binding protein [Bacteroidales bacterium]
MEITRTFDILDNYLVRFPEKQDALAAKKNGAWITYSSKDYVKNANLVSCGLLQLGIQKGDRILSVSNNRPEWNFLDMGMSQIGAVHVPVYPTISREEYQYILEHCEPKIIVVSDKSLYEKIRSIAETLLPGTTIYTFNDVPGALNFNEIIRLGESSEAENLPKVQEMKKSISPDDLLTIIYTSGTTGNPKGVMLSHRNVVTNAKGARNIHWFNDQHRMLSFLPICHIFERTINYHVQMEGIGIYYAENLGTIADNLREVKPQLMISVPRLIEKVYDKIISTGKSLPYIKKQIFFWAVNLGLKYDYVLKGNPFYRFQLALARKLVFSKWQASLGGNLGLIVIGGAALQPRLSRIFGAAGIPCVEGYGLTESSPVIAANNLRTGEVRVGTVGPVFENVEVHIAEDGEILTKGPCVMMGYYKDPEKTKEAIDSEGWLHTGDIGILVEG